MRQRRSAGPDQPTTPRLTSALPRVVEGLSDRLAQPLHHELDVIGLDFAPALNRGLVPIFRVTLEIFTRQLPGIDGIAGEFFSDVGVALQ
jgi:hypothetical protein